MRKKSGTSNPSTSEPVADGAELYGAIEAIAQGRHGDPFAVLGQHGADGAPRRVRAWLPGATSVAVVDASDGSFVCDLSRQHVDGFFTGLAGGRTTPFDYRLRVDWGAHTAQVDDPYRFGPLLGEMDLWWLSEGTHQRPYENLGAHPKRVAGSDGTLFSVWAPNARRVSVIGDFNYWDETRHPMRQRLPAGIWELFIPGVDAGACYKFALLDRHGHVLPDHADPYARQAELRPATASIVAAPLHAPTTSPLAASHNANDSAISIYEVHVGSWRRVPEQGNRWLTWDELGDQLIPYVTDLGFTHVELMPINEHPFDGSWGYQPTGLFAPTSRFGSPQDFKRFVDRCHAAGIGVLLDWVPGHFPKDEHALANFDGTHLYDHADPREGLHRDWGTLIYNFGRTEVRNFLIGNARFWIEQFGIDGLRVDAVASMLYRDYSRLPGEWVPNAQGGRENLEAIGFMRQMNETLGATHPTVATIAEESTAWPGVSRPTSTGGLGFHYKWNMGWMNDTLRYMGRDTAHRRYHHNELTFGLVYGFDEHFVLPLSHDEVVHGKGSLIGRMPGDRWQKMANLRLYYTFMFGHPGKKLLFMGGEFAQDAEWHHDRSLDWHQLDDPLNRGIQSLVRDLNHLYRAKPSLHRRDHRPDGFEWISHEDAANSVLSFVRRDETSSVVVLCNFTPVPRFGYRVGVPRGGRWRECLNSDSGHYGGSNVGNLGELHTQPVASHGREHSLVLTLPPLGALILEGMD